MTGSTAMLYGAGNTGPHVDVWRSGERVQWIVRGSDYGARGVVADGPPRTAAQTGHTWVRWNDGTACYVDPGCIDRE